MANSVRKPLRSRMAICHPDKLYYAKGKCRSCYEQWLRKINPEFRNRQIANQKAWVLKFASRKKALDKAWLAKQDPNYRRGISLFSRFGITLDDYQNLLDKQNGVCAICLNPPRINKNLHVDHCHSTGKIRGLLCFRCNWGLSFFSDNPSRLLRAHKYLL